jgi:hypothetical protein
LALQQEHPRALQKQKPFPLALQVYFEATMLHLKQGPHQGAQWRDKVF